MGNWLQWRLLEKMKKENLSKGFSNERKAYYKNFKKQALILLSWDALSLLPIYRCY